MDLSLRLRSFRRTRFTCLLVLGLLGVSGIAWAGTDVGNGMPVGIARGQTARLNVLSPADRAAACTARLQFFDHEGNLLAHYGQRIQPGHLVSLDLRADEARMGWREDRVQVYGVVRVDRAQSRACRDVVATLEVFDNESLRTSVVVVPPNPIMP